MNSIGAVSGLSTWLAAFDRDSAVVSRASSDSSSSPTADLTDGMVGMQSDAIGVRLGIQIIKSQDEMVGSIIDMLA
jgi:hypothetical protein